MSLMLFPNLIIDVRLNRGGSDDAFFNLLPYLFEDKEISLSILQKQCN